MSMSTTTKMWRIAANGAALVVVISCAPSSQNVSASSGPTNPTSSALTQLATIPVAKEKPARYKRSLFSEGKDVDKDGCKTRQEVLIRDSSTLAQVAQPGCEVTAGDWLSAYDGKAWSNPGDVEVDHVVSLKEVWDSGGYAWNATKRAEYANDVTNPLTLRVVTKSVKRQKGDKDPSNWLPPLVSYRCTYLENWVAIKARWGLSMDPSEFGRLKRLLTECARTSTTTTQPKNSTSSSSPSTQPSTTKPTASTNGSSTRALLDTISVQKERGSGYLRSLFPHWKDLDGDGCDTREEVLIRDSVTAAQVDPFGCQVVAGDWVSPYDGAKWTDRGDIDIDHVVALKEAWDSGAWAWTTAQRTAYANDLSDPRTLLAVTDSVNQEKSDKDPSNWMPPLASYHCTYLDSWVSVKARWKLSMDESEFARVTKLLGNCPESGVASPVVISPLVASPATSSPVTSNPGLSTPVVPNPVSTELKVVSPGAFCTPIGARGISKTGLSYLCATTSATGEAYKDGRARWRQG